MIQMNEQATPPVEANQMRTVMVGGPSYDGTVTTWHTAAMVETSKIGLARNINIIPMYMCYDALVQRARNDMFKLAIETNVDDLVFIDQDQDWNPADLFKLLSHDVAIVGAPVVKKSDVTSFNVKSLKELHANENGLCEVDSVGTGFMRIRKDALQKIWNTSPEYREPQHPTPCRMVFNIDIIDGELYSEDTVFCRKWTQSGEKVYIDPTIIVGHVGIKRWRDDFITWYNGIIAQKVQDLGQNRIIN